MESQRTGMTLEILDTSDLMVTPVTSDLMVTPVVAVERSEFEQLWCEYKSTLSALRGALHQYVAATRRLQDHLDSVSDASRCGISVDPDGYAPHAPRRKVPLRSEHPTVRGMRAIAAVRAALRVDADNLHVEWAVASDRTSARTLPSWRAKSTAAPTTALTKLTSQEILALQLLADGYSSSQVAMAAGVERKTVEDWLQNATRILDASGPYEAAAQAIWHDIIL